MQQTKLRQLQKILAMMALCHRYLQADQKNLLTGACNPWSSLKADAEKRVELRTRVMARLKAYYAKKCFGLYLASLQEVENQPPEKPIKLNTDAGWNPEGVRRNNELIIYGPNRNLNALPA